MGTSAKHTQQIEKKVQQSSPKKAPPPINKPTTGVVPKNIAADDGASAQAKAVSGTLKSSSPDAPKQGKPRDHIENKRKAQRQTIDDSDEDDDDDDGWEDATPSESNGKKANEPQPKASTEINNTHAAEPAESRRQDIGKGVNGRAEDSGPLMPSQAQSGPSNPVKTSSKRVMRTFYNDAGEEVTGRYSI